MRACEPKLNQAACGLRQARIIGLVFGPLHDCISQSWRDPNANHGVSACRRSSSLFCFWHMLHSCCADDLPRHLDFIMARFTGGPENSAGDGGACATAIVSVMSAR